MKLPNAERAIVDLAKLTDYCLNSQYEFGKHKARVFESALGLTRADAAFLCKQLLAAASGDAAEVGRTEFGVLYVIDFEIRTSLAEATIRSGWIVSRGEEFSRLTTCYVKRNS
ncbi:MAG TPA: hypothetical protein VGF59_09315 [Bryobacteraceae bacterium]